MPAAFDPLANIEAPPAPIYIEDKRALMREANQKAQDGADAWNAQSVFINDYCRANNYTDEQHRHRRDVDWGLKDHFSTYQFWAAEVGRHGNTIVAEIHIEVWEMLQEMRAMMQQMQQMMNAVQAQAQLPSPRRALEDEVTSV